MGRKKRKLNDSPVPDGLAVPPGVNGAVPPPPPTEKHFKTLTSKYKFDRSIQAPFTQEVVKYAK